MKKILSLFAIAMMALTAQATEITWDASVINSILLMDAGTSFSNSGITVEITEMLAGGFYGSRIQSGGQTTFVFSSTVGNIESITINAGNVSFNFNGWTQNGNMTTWNGTPASSVTASANLVNINHISSIVFTIEESTAVENATADAKAEKVVKRIVDGQLIIERDGKMYNANGIEIK